MVKYRKISEVNNCLTICRQVEISN